MAGPAAPGARQLAREVGFQRAVAAQTSVPVRQALRMLPYCIPAGSVETLPAEALRLDAVPGGCDQIRNETSGGCHTRPGSALQPTTAGRNTPACARFMAV
jgi:hypothetical protein